MEASATLDRMKARIQRVEEHIRHENSHNLAGILGTFGPDARYDDEPWNDRRVGRDQVELYYQQLLAAAPDLQIVVNHRHVTDEVVILEVTISGTQTGPWRGLPGTGRPFRVPLCAIYTFDPEDRLSGEKIYYDRAAIFKQLGVFREPTGFLGQLSTVVNHPWTLACAFGRKIIGP